MNAWSWCHHQSVVHYHLIEVSVRLAEVYIGIYDHIGLYLTTKFATKIVVNLSNVGSDDIRV